MAFSQLDDEFLAIDAQTGYCYSLNGVAGRVWALIETPTAVSIVCSRLGQEYAVDQETCLHDVVELLQNLAEAGLVEVSDASAQ